MVARPSQDNSLMIWTSSLEDQEEKNVIQACAKSRIQDGFPSSSTSLCSTIGSIEIVEKVKINTASAAEARRMNIPLSSLRVPQTHHHVSLFRASGHSDGSISVVGLPRSRNGKDLHIINKIGSSDAVCALQFGPSRWIPSKNNDVRVARVSLISGMWCSSANFRHELTHYTHSNYYRYGKGNGLCSRARTYSTSGQRSDRDPRLEQEYEFQRTLLISCGISTRTKM